MTKKIRRGKRSQKKRIVLPQNVFDPLTYFFGGEQKAWVTSLQKIEEVSATLGLCFATLGGKTCGVLGED